jgi:hypothetical protein
MRLPKFINIKLLLPSKAKLLTSAEEMYAVILRMSIPKHLNVAMGGGAALDQVSRPAAFNDVA